ncbi:unnamed protein product [Thelazia callipaeda]|uniref:Glutaminase n=1 Tax=Thelazia callipaeda TaxID=103827 RepID=A0A0N5D429_THECL|nr:unnamed protein product [Thelazia callipaeda]
MRAVTERNEKNKDNELAKGDHNDEKDSIPSYLKLFIHDQAEEVDDAYGILSNRDALLGGSRFAEDATYPEQSAFKVASQMAYLIRGRENDEGCELSVAACDFYTSMWPQIDGLCDLFFVKCLVEVAGLICRNYTETSIFQYAADLCDNVSDFCSQNREAVIAFCWSHLYQRFGESSMEGAAPKSKFSKIIEFLI